MNMSCQNHPANEHNSHHIDVCESLISGTAVKVVSSIRNNCTTSGQKLAIFKISTGYECRGLHTYVAQFSRI